MPIKLYPTPGGFLQDNAAFLHKYEVQSQLNRGNAAFCRDLLASGKAYVTLFVDKKNPISNRVYRKIGFDVLEDASDYRLV